MPALQVRDFPEELYEQLKDCAKREHRSIAQQTVACVDWYVNGAGAPGAPLAWRGGEQERRDRDREPIWMHHELPPEQVEERRKLFAELEALPIFDVPDGFPSAVELIREDRDAR